MELGIGDWGLFRYVTKRTLIFLIFSYFFLSCMDILGVIDGHIGVAEGLKGVCVDIEAVCKVCGEAVLRGNKIILCGNGGSAADAQHIAAEFVGRFVKERRGLAAMALTVDTSALTAIGNDYGFDEVFARQLSALGRAGDVFIGISTSASA